LEFDSNKIKRQYCFFYIIKKFMFNQILSASCIDIVAAFAVVAGSAAWLYIIVVVGYNALSLDMLSRFNPPLSNAAHLPSLSVIIPACNEEDTIEAALRALLQTTYPRLEVVVVNDRSTDATGEIAERVAAEDERVKSVHIQNLPEGWLGKTHALHIASRAARGDFLLFTDADIHFAPSAFARAVGYAEARGLDHLAVMPEIRQAAKVGAWERAQMSAAIAGFVTLFLFAMRPRAVQNPKSDAYIGVGAFNLVRRSAFERTQGFEWLKMEAIDDVGLGLMMKRSGAACAAANGVGLVWLEWYSTLKALARGFEKNFFAGFAEYRLSLLAARLAQILAVALLPLWGGFWLIPLLGVSPLAGFCLTSCFAPAFAAMLWRSRSPLPPASFAAMPLAFGLVGGLIFRSAWSVLRRKGILWRDSFYPLETLRREQRVKTSRRARRFKF
jgi:cellulose synthase/poly-beta-1,6-N-acetylglucosamine synthase-like glycosyltransferase